MSWSDSRTRHLLRVFADQSDDNPEGRGIYTRYNGPDVADGNGLGEKKKIRDEAVAAVNSRATVPGEQVVTWEQLKSKFDGLKSQYTNL